jgi:hypothetical protein
VRFDVRLRRDDLAARVTVETKVSRRTPVRASTGSTEPRLFVKAHIRLGGREHLIEIGLVDRRHMLYRMLLGRSAIERHYLVDVSKRYALGSPGGARLVGKTTSTTGRKSVPDDTSSLAVVLGGREAAEGEARRSRGGAAAPHEKELVHGQPAEPAFAKQTGTKFRPRCTSAAGRSPGQKRER